MASERKPAKSNRNATVPVKSYEPTPRERAAVDANFAKGREKSPAPALKVERKGNVRNISNDHADLAFGGRLLMEAVGTTDPNFLHGLLCQLSHACERQGEVTEDAINFMLSVVKGIEPKDQVEAMLAAQMAVVHAQTMTFVRKLNSADYLPRQDSAERALNKLARTYTMQMEALKKCRTGGQQKVTVEHVTVNEGGQAIVGNVETGGRGASKKPGATS